MEGGNARNSRRGEVGVGETVRGIERAVDDDGFMNRWSVRKFLCFTVCGCGVHGWEWENGQRKQDDQPDGVPCCTRYSTHERHPVVQVCIGFLSMLNVVNQTWFSCKEESQRDAHSKFVNDAVVCWDVALGNRSQFEQP